MRALLLQAPLSSLSFSLTHNHAFDILQGSKMKALILYSFFFRVQRHEM